MNRRRWTAVAATACAVAALTTVEGVNSSATPAPVAAKDPAKVSRTGLGNGLGALVAQSQRPQSLARSASLFDPERTVIRDAEGRVLIDLTPQTGVDRAAYRAQAEQLGLVVAATDPTWGTLEGYAPVSAMTALATLSGTGTIVQAVKPAAASGRVQDQGVAFQNVDKPLARGINGKGITVGALSDSYDSAATYVTGEPLDVHAAQDVASGDLPGPGNRQNQTPVKVLQDIPTSAGGADEGRAMLQIIHDLAPQADLCFATAFAGEVQFADNIRKLADPKGGCGADVVVDDVGYFDEPFFSDGILNDAVDDVTAQGVQYFSSAGNAGEHNAWRSPIRLVPAASAAAGTNLDLSDVDPSLYDGGLQDFDPGSGVDTAQNYVFGAAGGLVNLQWDNPIDYAGPTIGTPYFTGSGTLAAGGETDLTYTATAAQVGTLVQFQVDGNPSGSVDLVLDVVGPDGTDLTGPVDTGSSPETAVLTLPAAGEYTIKVTGFQGSAGPFTAKVSPILKPSKVTDDFNLLFFDMDGHFLGAQADVNSLTGRPQELISLPGLGKVQVAIGRSGTGPLQATTLAQVANGDVFVDEYWDPTAPATYGHPTAAGAVGVAAFDPFKPYLPESFTSAGSDKLPIYFDSSGNRYKKVQTRTSPLVASVDGANTTFFVSDTPLDPDTDRNFFGTSAAAPHAAAISALVLQANGGSGSVTPKRMKKLLASSTFAHDLDPFYSSGKADKLTITASGDSGDERSAYAGPRADPNFFKATYKGKVPLASITFFGDTASPSANGKGIVFDPRPFSATDGRNSGYPFTVGTTGGGLDPSSVFATFAGKGGGQSTTGQYRTMTVRFSHGLAKGQSVGFGVDRDLQSWIPGLAAEGNSADELGGAVLVPSGAVVQDGMQFRATRTDGTSFEGVFRNDLGTGYSVADGYGLLDAAQAVLGR